jgi:hypothetical protein
MLHKYKFIFTVTLIFLINFPVKTFCQYDLTIKQEQKGYYAIKTAKIKSATQVEFKFTDGKPDTDGREVMYNEFDSTGKCIHWIRYWPDGTKMEENNKYAFDEKGHITGITSLGMDGHVDTRSENIFDVKGNEIESDKFDTGGALMTTWKHIYDNKDREIEQTIIKGSDPIPLRKVYIYDDVKNTIETDFFRQDTMTYKYITLYNKENNPVEENQFTPGGEHTRQIYYSYDSTGHQTEIKTCMGDGKPVSVTKFKYDKFGNILEETRYNSQNEPQTLVKYNYEFYK